MKKVRYGLAGFGGIAESRIAKEGFGLDRSRFNGNDQAELVCATDINPARKGAASALGLRWYGTLEEMLGDRSIDALFVTTNNLSHYPVTREALLRGKHCIVEKPVATRMEDAEDLRAIAAERRLSLSVDHMMIYNAYNRRAKDLAVSGAIGEVNDISLHMEFLFGATAAEASTWRCADPRELGGPIGDVGSHCLYMAEFLLDSPIVQIGCVYLPKRLGLAVEEGAHIQFQTASGVWGSCRVAFNATRGGAEGTLLNLGFEMYGTAGVLRGYGTLFQLSGHPGEPVKLRLELERGGSVKTETIEDAGNIYQRLIDRHAESVMKQAPLDCAEAIHNLELILSCHRSARQGGAAIRITR
jgi:predicted dehydrogenase